MGLKIPEYAKWSSILERVGKVAPAGFDGNLRVRNPPNGGAARAEINVDPQRPVGVGHLDGGLVLGVGVAEQEHPAHRRPGGLFQ